MSRLARWVILGGLLVSALFFRFRSEPPPDVHEPPPSQQSSFGTLLDRYEHGGISIRTGMLWDDFLAEMGGRPMENVEVIQNDPPGTIMVLKRVDLPGRTLHVRFFAERRGPGKIIAIWSKAR